MERPRCAGSRVAPTCAPRSRRCASSERAPRATTTWCAWRARASSWALDGTCTSTAPTRGPRCGSAWASSRASAPPARSTATPRCGGGRWSASPSRCARWEPQWKPPQAGRRFGCGAGRSSGLDYAPAVASAQLKSAVLLAGLRARGRTQVREPLPSRDHTERMLGHFGVQLARDAGRVVLVGGQRLRASAVPVPGDPSSAAFLAGGRIAGTALGGARACRRAEPDADRCTRDPASHGSRHPRRGRA